MSKKLRTRIIVTGLTVALVVTGMSVPGSAAALTEAQIQSILSLLQSFGADAGVVSNVETSLRGQTPTTPTTPSTACNFTRSLFVGVSAGEDVRCLQQYLNAAGHAVATTGAGSVGNETTTYGPLTQAAVGRWQAANGVNPAVGYFGPISRAKYTELAGTVAPGVPTVPGVTVPADGIAISLAAGNPAGATLPQGAAGVVFVEFNVAGNGTLNSLTFERRGPGATGDFSNVYLYEGDTRLTSGRTVNSTTHQVFFASLGLNVSGVRTLRVVADIGTSLTAGNEHRFALISSSGTPSPTGTPEGNVMRIGGVSAGTISVSSTSTPANPSVGQSGAQIAQFELSAGTAEDLSLRRITLTHGGTLARARLTNLELRIDGTTVASASGLDSNDRVTFVLSSPHLLEKGQVATVGVYGDIASDARANDTIAIYIDSSADIQAIGQTHGFPALATITGFNSTDAAATLTVQAGDVTVAHTGPVGGEIGLRANDVVVTTFTINALNNIEIRNLRLTASTTAASGSNPKFNDLKVWDASTNSVLTSSFDVTSSTTSYVFTDPINVASGQTRSFRVTVDVDSANINNDAIHVGLASFIGSDIRNLDNNTYVSTSDIVGTGFTGNKMTVATPQVDIQLSGSPTSKTVARGATGVDLVAFTFRAIADDITLTTVKVHASSSSGTLTSSEVLNLKLMDGSTTLGTKSLTADGSAFSMTYDNLSVLVTKGSTKTLTVRGDISSDAGVTDNYYAYIAAIDTGSVQARDSSGRSLASANITGSTANSNNAVVVRVASAGTITSAVAPEDVDTEAGIVVANGERILAKFQLTAENEAMTINKLRILVNATNEAAAASTVTPKYVSAVKLYDGTTQIGASGGYAVTGSGANAGIAFVQDLSWTISQDVTKTLVVKGVLATIDRTDRPMGQSVYAHLQSDGFEATGSTGDPVTTMTARSGAQKVVYKTKPTISSVTSAGATLVTGEVDVMNFTIAADSAGQVAWKQIQFRVIMSGATMTAVSAVPSTTGNVRLRDVVAGSDLNIASAFSGTNTTTGEQVAITGGQTGYVSLLLNTEQVIAAGGSKNYKLTLTFADVPTDTTSASAQLRVHRTETTLVNATTLADVRISLGTATDAAPSFVWSDYTADDTTASHSDSTKDWANSVFVKELPSVTVTTSK